MSLIERLRLVLVITTLVCIAGVGLGVFLVGSTDGAGAPGGWSTRDVGVGADGEIAAPNDIGYSTFAGESRVIAPSSVTPMVINFFASTCAACVEEMPVLEAAHEHYGDQVEFLGLAVADRADEARALVERAGITFPIGQDRDGSAIGEFGGTVLPMTVVITSDRRVAAVHRGKISGPQLRRIVDDLVPSR
jgi:thiol-disulfide isomerase/thioredoxin